MKNWLNEENMVKIAWTQVILSIPCLVVFPFLSTKWQIILLGVVTMITWTGTGLSHISASRANRELVVTDDDSD